MTISEQDWMGMTEAQRFAMIATILRKVERLEQVFEAYLESSQDFIKSYHRLKMKRGE